MSAEARPAPSTPPVGSPLTPRTKRTLWQTSRSSSHESFDSTVCRHIKAARYSYCDHDRIGKGTFGNVYRVKVNGTDEVVAVKVMKDAGLKFVREASALMRLKHPGIVQLVDTYIADTLHIVFEFMEHGDLYEWVTKQYKGVPDEQRPVISARTEIALTRQIGAAIAYCHGSKIAHRDLKLDNVLVARLDPIEVKITDFGLCFVTSAASSAEEGDDNDNTRYTHEAVGSTDYAAPEIYFRRTGDVVDPYLCDVWAFGILLFATFHNFFPWRPERARRQLLEGKRLAPPRRLDEKVARHVCDPVRFVIESALEFDPEKRPDVRTLVLPDGWQGLGDEVLDCVAESESSSSSSYSYSGSDSFSNTHETTEEEEDDSNNWI